MKFQFYLMVLAGFGFFSLTSCETTGTSRVSSHGTTAAVSDHEPRFDYWENGGGACCPHHANQLSQRKSQAKP